MTAQDPKCPSGVLLFQHGKYEILSNGSLSLTPFVVDGRQLVSEPCTSDTANYMRYNQSEFFKSFDVQIDEYHGRYRLDLFQFDGSPLPPLYLAYKPPMMLPTETMNPTAAGQATSTSTVQKVRRALENRGKTTAVRKDVPDLRGLWWIGVSLIFVGATGWYCL
ncbi:Rot1p [Sugiyamaella lignohabitans]|uniref:Protein ROT1 n=1 Tax=Sugiyamaella lignohabitans TaxID=796027 RepID=A0A161HF78_9ASCO|nr:Rot1p [Sugiyamaella lignohabitans]ANB14130.1 Rot1p [Sugiyamaella lignohabitans]